MIGVNNVIWILTSLCLIIRCECDVYVWLLNVLFDYNFLMELLPCGYNSVTYVWRNICGYILWRKGPVLHGRMGEDGVLLLWLYTLEEGTRNAREDRGRRDIIIIAIYYWRKGPVLHGWSVKTVL